MVRFVRFGILDGEESDGVGGTNRKYQCHKFRCRVCKAGKISWVIGIWAKVGIDSSGYLCPPMVPNASVRVRTSTFSQTCLNTSIVVGTKKKYVQVDYVASSSVFGRIRASTMDPR